MKNWYWYILGIIILIALIKQCEDKRNKEFKDKIIELQKANEQLNKLNEIHLLKIDSINKIILYKDAVSDTLIRRLDSLKKIRHEIPKVIRDYSDAKLDSILTNHRHIQR